MEPNMKNEKDSMQRLTNAILTIHTEMKEKIIIDEDEEDELTNDIRTSCIFIYFRLCSKSSFDLNPHSSSDHQPF